MKEEGTLMEVEKDGEEIILLNGRRLSVSPNDMPTVCIWIPTAELEILDGRAEKMVKE